MMTITEYKFRSKKKAQNMQRKMKREYGYTPSLIMVRNPRTGKLIYMVVKPKGLKRVHRPSRRKR